MEQRSKLEVHFYDQKLASVVSKSHTDWQPHKADLMVFSFFTVRILHNLGNRPERANLGNILFDMTTHAPRLIAAADPDAPKLVPFSGTAAPKRLIGDFVDTGSIAKFNMDLKGFGLLGFGLNFYAPNAVFLAFRHLVAEHPDDELFLNRLMITCAGCGTANRIGLTTFNQSSFAGGACELAMKYTG